MGLFEQKISIIKESPKYWLVTGAAGFIGSNLIEFLLLSNQKVVGLDNFSTGHSKNLDEIRSIVSKSQWNNFTFIEGDISNFDDCSNACKGVDYVLHQAALGSVPRSIANPITTNHSNITGFLNILVAARDAKVKSFTYAASSSTYGDHPALPKIEQNIGKPLSPYAITKYVNELYAEIFFACYEFNSIGLRYFNVFGKRQDPNGAYAAVIPKWIDAMISGKDVVINGDGKTTRDFCYIENVIQANILAAMAENSSLNNIYNVAKGDRTSLNDLFHCLKNTLKKNGVVFDKEPKYKDFRGGDVRHSQADISKAENLLGYVPSDSIFTGIEKVIPWYVNSQ